METILSRSGQLTVADVRAFARRERRSMIGPTSLYYAGVTAPMITASVATMVGAALSYSGWSAYWATLSAAIVACLAGIVWYLIFVRWAYRPGYGRGFELEAFTEFSANEEGIRVERGGVVMRANWSAVAEITNERKYIALTVLGGENVVLPKSWFKSADEKNRFHADLIQLKEQYKGAAEVAHG